MTRDELKEQIDKLMREYADEEIDGATYSQRMKELTTTAQNEYNHCPYCSGELDDDDDEVRPCPECGGCLHWDGEIWECSNCDYTEED